MNCVSRIRSYPICSAQHQIDLEALSLKQKKRRRKSKKIQNSTRLCPHQPANSMNKNSIFRQFSLPQKTMTNLELRTKFDAHIVDVNFCWMCFFQPQGRPIKVREVRRSTQTFSHTRHNFQICVSFSGLISI